MVSPTNDVFPTHRPAPLAWKEFRRRSGFSTQPKVYVYDSSPQIVPNSPPITSLNLSPIINNIPPSLALVDSPRREQTGYFLSHVSQALQVLGASTGGNIAEYIANNFSNEYGLPYEKGRKLHYMVNAILSSPKYKYLFLKDQVLKDEKRSLWRLKKPEENLDDDTTVPNDMSLSALIPPTSPCLSLKLSSNEVPSLSSSQSISVNSSTAANNKINNNNNNNNNNNTDKNTNNVKDSYGGSDEAGHNDEDEKGMQISRTTEHPPSLSLSALTSPSSSLITSPTSPDPSSPPLGDTPSLSLSSRRKKRKGLDSSTGIEPEMGKQIEEQPMVEEKKRRLDLAP